MTCQPFNDGRFSGIVCTRGRSVHKCHWCGLPAQYQCDHPVFRDNKKGTCDRWMCDKCRHLVGKNLDLCSAHFRFWENNGKRFLLGGEVLS